MNNDLNKKAFELYLKEERAECERLIQSGCLVNYREFTYEQFVDAGTKIDNPWYSFFNKKFNYYLNRVI